MTKRIRNPKPIVYPLNCEGMFKMGEHEFPLKMLFEKDPWPAPKIKRRRVKFIITQNKQQL